MELVNVEDLPRFHALNVAASMQALQVPCCVGRYYFDRVGVERTREEGFPWKTMLDSGASLNLGSDWPTASVSPMQQLTVAQDRKIWLDGQLQAWDDGGNALGFDEALYAYTQANADMTPLGDRIGSITPGKWADFVILDTTIAESGFRDLNDVSVAETWFSGRNVYSRQTVAGNLE